jgi:membrane protein implicated in regulation of membrane protease activity
MYCNRCGGNNPDDAVQCQSCGADLKPPVKQLFAASIMTYALCYTIIVYGFVLFFISGVTMNFYIFMGIALLFFVLFRPQYSQWEERIESQGQ